MPNWNTFIKIMIGISLWALLSSCAHIGPPNDNDMQAIKAGQKTLVLLRIVHFMDGQLKEYFLNNPINNSNCYGEMAVCIEFADINTGNKFISPVMSYPLLTASFSLSEESLQQGWFYLLFEPGIHYLSVRDARYADPSQYIWKLEVPSQTRFLYAGTISIKRKSRNVFLDKIPNELTSAVIDETSLALQQAANYLPSLGPLRTILFSPHDSRTLNY